MDHYQKKQQQYARWNQSVWNSVQKELSLFQKKVTDIMIELGDITKKTEQQFKAPPFLETDVVLGQEFYIQQIRPLCVQMSYLPKQIPRIQDLNKLDSDQDSQQQIQKKQQKMVQKKSTKQAKQEEKGAKKGKKGSKNNKGKGNEQKMKIQIAKQNFKKDINMVLASHSMERMQIQFGLKQEKIEVKLTTFFYIAYYIRKNKVNQKIEESIVFELINILIKIIRIFSGLQGPSYMNHEQKMQISKTLILDLKFCVEGLKQFYKYDNRTVIIKYPKLVYYTSYDKFFPTLDIKPYKSQIQLAQTIKMAFNQKCNVDTPILILYKPMIGSGKTTAALALSQMVKQLKLKDEKNKKLQLVYCCVITSVRIQLGRYAYNKEQKFALSAMQPSIKDERWMYPKVINSWSCRNEQFVDLLISDAYCTYTMLDKHHLTDKEKDIMENQRRERKKKVTYGKLDRESTILFIDQPTAFCKDVSSPITRRIFNILANYPPKITILSSATMPNSAQLQKTIQLVRLRNPNLKVIEIDSQQFQIGCQYCSFKGDVIFPHTGVRNQKQLKQIIELLHKNSFLLRLYTGPSLFFLIRRCERVGLKKLPKINELPEVRQDDILNATFKILNNLATQADQCIQEVCKLQTEESNIDFKDESKSDDDDDLFIQDQKQQEKDKGPKKDYVNFKKMLKSDAYKFLGGCLIGTSDPLQFAHAMFDKWVQDIKPIKRLMDKYKKDQQALDKQIKLIQADKQMRQQKKTQKISKLMDSNEVTLDFPEHKKINTSQHYHKYCVQKNSSHNTMLIKPVPVANIGEQLIDQVDDFLLKLLFCGVAIYMNKGISAKYLDKVEELASMNYLAYIVTDQSLCYGTNFPISNVILRDDLAEKLNMNQMFQLIGRAGRVGQSWTARAFLEGFGLAMLKDYIHKKEKNQASEEAKIFQQIAQQHLDYPLLKMRTLKSEIRYKDFVQNSNNIEILIKKKNEAENDLFKNICLVPYVVNQKDNTLSILCIKQKFEGINYYSFPSSQLLYDDIPVVENSKGEEIIDVAWYYKDQVKFITQTINRAVRRVIQDDLKNAIGIKNQKNGFKPKEYVPFFDRQTSTLAILVQENVTGKAVQGYQYQNLSANNIEKFDDVIAYQLQAVIQKSKTVAAKIRQLPQGLTENQVKQIIKTHNELLKKDSAKFYKAAFAQYFRKGQKQYSEILEAKGFDKQAIQELEFKYQSMTILGISHCEDLRNITDKHFHIDKQIRRVWNHLQKTMFGEA